jgi:hypothetical protein
MTERTSCADGDAEDVFTAARDAALAYRTSLISGSYRTGQDYRQMCDHFTSPFPKKSAVRSM